jgi:thiamine biosynthesis lipoprotein
MNEYRIAAKLMGSVFELKAISDEEEFARRLLNNGINEIRRIEALLTEFNDRSVTSLLNHNAGKRAVNIPAEVYQLIVRCIRISELTQGAFDITIGPLKQLYDFRNGEFAFPDDSMIGNAIARIGYQHIHCSQDNTIYLEREAMHISFAAIGKGYAADRVKRLWQSEGIQSGVINASGDLTAFGRNRHNEQWRVGIANPDRRDEVILYFPIEDGSVATSGDYEQFFYRHGVRYSHNIDPKTGKPLTGIKSVSIVSPSAELSDALATAVYVMGVEAGLHFVNQLPNTHCLIIDDGNSIHHSHALHIEYVANTM